MERDCVEVVLTMTQVHNYFKSHYIESMWMQVLGLGIEVFRQWEQERKP